MDTAQGPRGDAEDRRGHLGVRRPGHAVRHHDQRLAHLPGTPRASTRRTRARVHVPRRLGLQPGVAEPDEVPPGARRVRHRRVPLRHARDDHGQEIIVDNSSYPTRRDRRQQPRLPAAGPRLRQPGRAADEPRAALRQRHRPRLRRGPHRGDVRPGLPDLGRAWPASRGPFAGYAENREPLLRVIRKHRDGGQRHQRQSCARRTCWKRRESVWDDAYDLGHDYGYRNARSRCWRRPAPSAS
jgi:hypothetical protein